MALWFLELRSDSCVLVFGAGPLVGRRLLILWRFLPRLNDLVIRGRREVLDDAVGDGLFERDAHVHLIVGLLQADEMRALSAADQGRQPIQQRTRAGDRALAVFELLVTVLRAPVFNERLVQGGDVPRSLFGRAQGLHLQLV